MQVILLSSLFALSLPQQASDSDFVALTIIVESLNVLEVPSNLCFVINVDFYFVFFFSFSLQLRQQY